MLRSHSLRLIPILLALALLLVLAPTASANPPAIPSADGFLPGCTGEYFNNATLAGAPALVRSDAAINFFWSEGTSPGAGVTTNNYSVRWTCSVFVGVAGNYTFTALTDDGMNVLVDGNLVIWAWFDQGPTTYAATTSISAGWHTILVQYYNRTLGGTARVSSSIVPTPPPPTTFPDWKGEYFNNQTLTGAPTITRNDPTLNFDWSTGSPDPAIPIDHFSARWTRTQSLTAGTWRFTMIVDDGGRLWVDGNLLIDKWIDQPPTTYSADIALPAGDHSIRMEYYENAGGATAKLAYALVTAPPSGAWHGQYFNNIALTGAPVLVRDDAAVNFNWLTGSPSPVVPADFFSVKWDSVQTLATTGTYSIAATSDDGVRVWIDGNLVIDGWYDHAPMTFTATPYLIAGMHAIHVEYYERAGGAMVTVSTTPGSVPPPPPPPPVKTDVIVDDKGVGWQAGGTGTWRNAAAGINGHAFWTLNNTYTAYGYNWARWYPTLPGAGYYEVFAYLPDSLGTTLNARYWIFHNNKYDVAPRAQGFYPEQWISLGTYYFSALGGEYVSLSDVTYECYLCRSVSFDAIKFSPR